MQETLRDHNGGVVGVEFFSFPCDNLSLESPIVMKLGIHVYHHKIQVKFEFDHIRSIFDRDIAVFLLH